MKRKLLIAILVVASCFACVFGLSACGDDEQSGNGGNTEQGGSGGNSGGGIASLNGYEYTVKDGGYEITKVKDARITEAVIPDSVTSIAMDAFRGCTELKKLVIPDSVTYIGFEAFAGCDNIEEVSCPASVISNLPTKTKLKTVNITSGSISDNLLKDCTSLTSINIQDSVADIESEAFLNCNSLESIKVSQGNTVFSSQDGILYNKEKTKFIHIPKAIKSVTVPDSITEIGYKAFYGCRSLTSITIPDSVTAIGRSAFDYCDKLIQIENGVSYVDKWIVGYDMYVTEISIRSNTKGIVDYAFYDCRVLARINFKDMASYCQIRGFSNVDKSKVYIGGQPLTGMTSIAIPDGMTSIDDSAFQGCILLESITIPDSVTSIGDSAFQGCSWLRSITIPDGVTSIGDAAFQDCSWLGSIAIPDSVTSIGERAFCECRRLTSITIGDGVTSIGERAFAYCSFLTDITFEGTKAQWNAVIKCENWNSNTGTYTIHCTDGDI